MRCSICGSPILVTDNDGRQICSRCEANGTAKHWSYAPNVKENSTVQRSKKPLTSRTIATGFTRSEPPSSETTIPSLVPPLKSEPVSRPPAERHTAPPSPFKKEVGVSAAPRSMRESLRNADFFQRAESSVQAQTQAPPASAASFSGDFVAARASLPLPSNTERDSVQPSSVVLDGKYRLIDELGRGSMGTVFLAEDIQLKRKVAVKFLLPELADSSECSVRFKREAIAMASIRNENVAQIFSYGEDKGTPYFVMEYLEGQTVEHLVDSYNRRGFFVPVSDAVDIMMQVLIGVAAIHKANAVHRDIKPGNIMITSDPMRAVIMDFGLVRDIKVEDDMRTLAGTPAYIAPELVEGKKGASKSKLADIYSLGSTFYEILTGSIPFNGTSWVEILQKHIAEIPEFPSSRRPGLPEVLDEIVLCAMSKEPKERFEGCEVFLDSLLEISQSDNNYDRRRISRMPSSAPGRRSATSSMGRHCAQSVRSSNSRESSRGFLGDSKYARGRLLVADGEHQFRSTVYNIAKTAVPSCRVHSATDGVMALDMLKSVKPHVLVIDLGLPEINGFEIVASIAGDPDYHGMVTIVVSQNSGAKDAQLLRAMGVKHFWTKPVDVEALFEAIRPQLEKPTT